MSAEELYSIKMRASKKENGTDVHISGAEKIVEAPDVDIFANAADRERNASFQG